MSAPGQTIALSAIFRAFLRVGLLSFGGPAGQIALMHREIVEKRRWLTEQDYLNALSFCMLLPGPEAMQLATYSGWRLRGVLGGLIAGLLFVIPGALVVLVLASVYVTHGDVAWVGAVFLGIKAAVVVIVFEALLKLAKRALVRPDHWVIAGLAFLAIFFLNLPFPLLIALAASYGFFTGTAADKVTVNRSTKFSETLATVLTWLVIWWLPLVVIALLAPGSILIGIGLFFAKLAVVTFGGAYAVLAYMAQQAVDEKGWLTAGQMIDGLGLAETTPGPLILVTEFVGYLAGFGAGGMALGMAAAAVTLWMTFAPCFLWIFAGAPYIERLSHVPRLRNALTGVTAAVVGVILNLTLWFGLHVFFDNITRMQVGWFDYIWPETTSLNPFALSLAMLAAVLLLRFKLGLGRVLAISALGGLLVGLIS